MTRVVSAGTIREPARGFSLDPIQVLNNHFAIPWGDASRPRRRHASAHGLAWAVHDRALAAGGHAESRAAPIAYRRRRRADRSVYRGAQRRRRREEDDGDRSRCSSSRRWPATAVGARSRRPTSSRRASCTLPATGSHRPGRCAAVRHSAAGQRDGSSTWRASFSPTRTHPLFFSSLRCDVGESRRFLNSVDGWAPVLLSGGAGGPSNIGAMAGQRRHRGRRLRDASTAGCRHTSPARGPTSRRRWPTRAPMSSPEPRPHCIGLRLLRPIRTSRSTTHRRRGESKGFGW